MPLSLVRVDDRLVHGQVVEGWIPHLRAELVIVASDSAAADETQVLLMRMALPESVDLEVLPVEQAARRCAQAAGEKRRTLVLAPGPAEAAALVRGGADIREVNVGGLHYTAGRVQLGRAIYISAADREALLELCRRGVRLEGRPLPSDKGEDLLEMLGFAGSPR